MQARSSLLHLLQISPNEQRFLAVVHSSHATITCLFFTLITLLRADAENTFLKYFRGLSWGRGLWGGLASAGECTRCKEPSNRASDKLLDIVPSCLVELSSNGRVSSEGILEILGRKMLL